MSDPSPTPPQPMWLRLINDQHFKLVMIYAFKTSGLSTMPILQKYFPGLTADSMATYAIIGLPFVISFAIDWWRNNPNNVIKRAVMVFNGPGKVSDESKAAIVEAADAVPGVRVKVNPEVAAPATVEMAKSPDNNVKMDKPA